VIFARRRTNGQASPTVCTQPSTRSLYSSPAWIARNHLGSASLNVTRRGDRLQNPVGEIGPNASECQAWDPCVVRFGRLLHRRFAVPPLGCSAASLCRRSASGLLKLCLSGPVLLSDTLTSHGLGRVLLFPRRDSRPLVADSWGQHSWGHCKSRIF